MHAAGLLTRLSLAWSRDSNEKIYVQHRIREAGRELWSWIDDGAHIYVCGDALRMAKDVELAFVDVIATHGGRNPTDAMQVLSELKASDRYQTDVY
jgi:sulfite reductase (NADPH) flavoprotein alpha-component